MKIFLKLLTISFLIHLGILKATTAQHRSNTFDKPENIGMVEIIGLDYAFDAPDEIPSSWTTFRFSNGVKSLTFSFHSLSRVAGSMRT